MGQNHHLHLAVSSGSGASTSASSWRMPLWNWEVQVLERWGSYSYITPSLLYPTECKGRVNPVCTCLAAGTAVVLL